MKIAITDACIFIDIYELALTNCFFSLNLEIHTSFDVFNELYEKQREQMSTFLNQGKLVVHNLTQEDRKEMRGNVYPKALSENDKTVIYLAGKVNAMVLSSDKAVRNCAENNQIEYHGMLWVFDQLVDADLITPQSAADNLETLILKNMVYQNNNMLVKEMDKRLKVWISV